MPYLRTVDSQKESHPHQVEDVPPFLGDENEDLLCVEKEKVYSRAPPKRSVHWSFNEKIIN